MTNNEKFNALLNGCQNPRGCVCGLTGLGGQGQRGGANMKDRSEVLALVGALLDRADARELDLVWRFLRGMLGDPA